MFSWGADSQRGFRLKKGSGVPTGAGPHAVNVSFHITDLSVGRFALAFVKSDGQASIIRTTETDDGRRTVTGQQKYVQCEEKIQAVSCGDDVVALLSETGKVLCMDPTHVPFSPRTPDALCKVAVSQVACGSHHSVALTRDGQVYTWGQDSRGQLGLGGKKKLGTSSPQHLRSLSGTPLVQVAAGGQQSFALSVSGGLFSWGGNDFGQLGLGDRTERQTPACVQSRIMKKAVHVSCGENHTAILTKDGAVLTFGSGQYGQLGHNSLRDELRPRLVAELWGAKVTKVACGRHHTLVLTGSMRVYSFGCGEQGQLGHREESHPSVPLPVQLPQDTNNGLNITNIYAGGNCSFAVHAQEAPKESNTDSVNNAQQETIEDMIEKWSSQGDSNSWKKMKEEIHRMFSSASNLNRCFLHRSQDKHFQTSPKYSGVNLILAQLAFEKLAQRPNVLQEVAAALLHLLPSMKEPVGVEGLRIFQLLHDLLRVIRSTKLAEAIAAAMLNLSAESLRVIVDWWSSLPSSTMVNHVKVWTQALSTVLLSIPAPRNAGVTNMLLVLQHMYNANSRIAGCQRIPEKTFCLEVSKHFLEEDLRLWRSMANMDINDQPLILCNFPFLMNLKSKQTVFDINSVHTQTQHMAAPELVYMWPYGWVPQPGAARFVLNLRRASLMTDTFTQLAAAPHNAFKKPLRVHLDEDPKVTDVYKRDFFHHLFENMMTTSSGMFLFNDSQTLAWFPSRATEEDKKNFYLFGVLCGLALYNQSIIDLPFPLALFKKLLDVEPTLEDLKEFSATGKTLQSILDYNDDTLEDLYMDFVINWDGTEVDLDPQDPKKPVTGQNKKEFVDAYVNYVFNTSVEGVFQEFKRGFFQVCEQDVVKLFQPEELQGALIGQENYDWVKLKKNTQYGWDLACHPIVKVFWEVFDELTEDQKRDFLRFVTGYRRVPILGMDQIKMKVRVKQIDSGSYDEHFPESLTCHSILELPLYSTKEILRDRLTKALTPERGFQPQ